MNRDNGRRVVLAAGGTGGHMFPAQALARELIARGLAVSLVTDKRGGGFGPELPQAETHHISAGQLAGNSPWRKLLGLANLGLGYLQARALLRRLQPLCVVGFGGYASVPTVLAASRLGLRVVLHEQNAVMGRANRLLARRAQLIATSYAQVENLDEGLRGRVAVTGNPVRGSVAQLGRKPYAVPGKDDRLRLLVTGGSQGARVFNELVPKALCQLDADLRGRIEVCQQVRGNDLDAMQETYKGCGIAATLAPFFDDLPERLAAAHLVICRAGASTVAELTAAGRPAILVPYPFATDDHQTANARALAEAGGGWLMPQSSLSAQALAERLASLLGTPALLARAAHNAHAIAHVDAARHLADLVCDASGGNGGARDKDAERKEAAA